MQQISGTALMAHYFQECALQAFAWTSELNHLNNCSLQEPGTATSLRDICPSSRKLDLFWLLRCKGVIAELHTNKYLLKYTVQGTGWSEDSTALLGIPISQASFLCTSIHRIDFLILKTGYLRQLLYQSAHHAYKLTLLQT